MGEPRQIAVDVFPRDLDAFPFGIDEGSEIEKSQPIRSRIV